MEAQQQQQPENANPLYEQGTYGAPPTSGGAVSYENNNQPQGGSTGGAGGGGGGVIAVLTSPPGILRAAEWLFTIISFGAMADLNGYDTISSFKWAVAAGVMTWLYVSTFLVIAIMDFYSRYPGLRFFEVVLDFVFSIIMLASGAATAAKCNEDIAGKKLCDFSGGDKAKASAAFAFLTFFCLLISLFFSYKKWQSGRASQ